MVCMMILGKKTLHETEEFINENKKLHTKISEDLLEKEEMDREEFAAYFA